VLLDLEWDRIEILLLLKQDSSAVIVPEVAEVLLNLLTQLCWNVRASSIWLVLDLFNQKEPTLQSILIVAEVSALHREEHIDETVHKHGEECDAENLDDTASDFLSDAAWIEVTVADC
jgi:hypothetical protein